ncbi:MAG: AIPR family protein [Nitrospirae bacterium]|nr:AIPR family protein [Nitrospirota bacterium]
MNINASIVDQRIVGILSEFEEYLPVGTDVNGKKSAAFVLLSMSTALDISIEEASELLTEGGNDVGIDGLHIGEVDDGEFTVTLFQGKYKVNDLSGTANFPENSVQKAVNTIATLFDPSKHIEMNDRIAPKVEEIRSLVRDGYIPNVRMLLCNNGDKWTAQAQNWIDQSGFNKDQVGWIHWNHDLIVSVLQKKKAVDDTIRLTGKAVIDDFNFRRVLLGKVPVTEIAELFNRHNDLLLERNIRRYLGLHSNRVNQAIHETLCDEQRKSNFYFFNNGITMICRKFRHNALQGENYQVKLESLQIINGGQTCKTIQQTLNKPGLFPQQYDNVYVLVRIYELADDDKDFVRDITYATNSQNPVDLRDLRSNDEIQRQLETGIKDLGYTYKRQREEGASGSSVVTSSIVAESVLAIWRRSPQQAKFRRNEHFGALYNTIFNDLNAAQALLAVLIFRFVENQRKRPESDSPPEFIPYASHYIAMVMGLLLNDENNQKITDISHKSYHGLVAKFETDKSRLYQLAIKALTNALKNLYGDRPVSLQQLSATFRRGDLLNYISAPQTKG